LDARQHLTTGLALVALAVALLALARSPASPAASHPAVAPPTAAPTITIAPSATPAPTITPAPSATEEPTAAPIVAPAATPCDPLTAPYQVKREISPIGRVVGVSCTSAAEAQANADSLAAQMIATAR
jgi:hypothetical protein